MTFQTITFAHQFSEQIARFLTKNERMSNLLKNERFARALIFGERPEQFAHGHSFLVSNLSKLLTPLTKKEGMSESLIF